MKEIIYHAESGALFTGRFTEHDAEQGCVTRNATGLSLGTRINTGLSYSTVHADIDFETYSEAGMYFDPTPMKSFPHGKWRIVPGAPKGCSSGLAAVGVVNYAAHPSTEVLSIAYDLKDGLGPRLWLPGMPPPQDLIEFVANGELVAAWNASFEYWVWLFVCNKRMGWGELPFWQLRCDMAKAQAFGLPGKLENAGPAIESPQLKGTEGMRLINKFSKPQNPLKTKPDRRRIFMTDEPEDGPKFIQYNIQDIVSEASIAALVPDLSETELAVWLYDQTINVRGVQIDITAVENFISIIEQAQDKYRTELMQLTGGTVKTESEAAKIRGWMSTKGVVIESLDEDTVTTTLEKLRNNPPPILGTTKIIRVLEIRQLLSSAAVKKLFSMKLKSSEAGRMHNIFTYCGAQKTARWAGRDIQPQNFPSAGIKMAACRACGAVNWHKADKCSDCGDFVEGFDSHEWDEKGVEAVLRTASYKNLSLFENRWGSPLAAISACLRGMLTCAQGNELLCSDFSAIEAVVLAMMSRCQWRIDVFNTHGKIYEMGASKISGIPFEEILAHKQNTGEHHPLRKTIGKVSELASGYQGWIGAWKNFGADKFMSDDEMKKAILKWRADSPEIVEFWGGQYRRTGYRQTTPELYGVEGCAIAAVMNPGQAFEHNGIQFGVKDDILYIQLPSGRSLTYHEPVLFDTTDPLGIPIKQLTFMGVHPTSKKWVRRDTYGGRLTENIVQAVARDIQASSIMLLEQANYSVVLHVHDEIISEVKEGTGSIEEFESIMSTMPAWAADWPIKATGGWRGKRYKKD